MLDEEDALVITLSEEDDDYDVILLNTTLPIDMI